MASIRNRGYRWEVRGSAPSLWQNGPSRGSSQRHDVSDTVIKLERPFNYIQQDRAKFGVHFDKNRTFAGNDAALDKEAIASSVFAVFNLSSAYDGIYLISSEPKVKID